MTKAHRPVENIEVQEYNYRRPGTGADVLRSWHVAQPDFSVCESLQRVSTLLSNAISLSQRAAIK